MPQLDFSVYISQIFWLFVSFGSFLFFTHFFVYPKIENRIYLRNEKIKQNVIALNKISYEIESYGQKMKDLQILMEDKIKDIELRAKFIAKRIEEEESAKTDQYIRDLIATESEKTKSILYQAEIDSVNDLVVLEEMITKAVISYKLL